MEKIFVFKTVARSGKLQLCVSIKGVSSERYYRVINTEHPDLSLLSNGLFPGKNVLAMSANREIEKTLLRARMIVSEKAPADLREFLIHFDGKDEDLTVGQYIESYIEELKSPNNGRVPSNGWRIAQTVLRKLQALQMDSIPLSKFDDDTYAEYCAHIRNGDAPDTRHRVSPNDQGCHGYRINTSTLKTILNKASRAGLSSPITYKWGQADDMPIATSVNELSRMNVPTEEEWQKFLQADLHRYTYANRDIKKLEMMRSIIIVLVETLSRPIDVLMMRSEDIKNMSWSYVPAKFKQKPISVKRKYKKPIGLTSLAYRCIVKHWNRTESGYVFPFKCNMVEHTDEHKYITQISNMGSKINGWLKLLTNSIFDKDMSLYSFRHFAITRAINRGMNVSEVATLAKTSIQQINATYYERDGIRSMEKLESLLNQ